MSADLLQAETLCYESRYPEIGAFLELMGFGEKSLFLTDPIQIKSAFHLGKLFV